MNDSLGTIWPTEPHTLAKHAILKEYLGAWMPIMARHGAKIGKGGNSEVLFLDGFAGPGIYSGGEDGSPIIALKAAMQHEAEFPIPIRFLFIELEKKRHESLVRCVNNQTKQLTGSAKVRVEHPVNGDCNSVLSGLLDVYEKAGVNFGPALVFLDQFGYSAVPMNLINKILKFPSCEVFSYLEYKHLNRFITDKTKWAGIDAAFGGSEWKEAIHLPPGQRDKLLLKLYRAALASRGNAKYIVNFSMYDAKRQPIYWLFFCTNNDRGLEEMKKAMWKVDSTGTFHFSDATDPSQELMFLNDGYNEEWLADYLWEKFKGNTISGSDFKDEVLQRTPCYLYRGAFGLLWKQERIRTQEAIGGRAPKFEEFLKIQFVASPKSAAKTDGQQSLF